MSSFDVQPTYESNSPNVSWTSVAGMAEEYVLTFTAMRTNTSFNHTTSDTMLQANLEYGEKYRIEIIAVFRKLSSSPVADTTIISNFFFHYVSKMLLYRTAEMINNSFQDKLFNSAEKHTINLFLKLFLYNLVDVANDD